MMRRAAKPLSLPFLCALLALGTACTGELTSSTPDASDRDGGGRTTDGGERDADRDRGDGGDRDSGPDAGLVCDTPCDTGNPCEVGVVDCDAGPPACLREAFAGEGTVCRAALGVCDLAEVCDGVSPDCPADARAAGDTMCRASTGPCDVVEERCDGVESTCPMDAFAATGVSCPVGFCDGLGGCMSGCTPGAACATGNVCETGVVGCGSGAPVCARSGAAAAGTICGATDSGSWGVCGGFTGTCGESGTQTRTVTSRACMAGTCADATSPESRACTRDRMGISCGTTTTGSWSACGGFSDMCDATGTRSRSVATPTCSASSCAPVMTTESEPCTRTVGSCATLDRSRCAGTTGTSARHCQIDIGDPANDSGMGYFEYLPTSYDGTRTHPVIIFFHGLGETGDGRAASATGLNKVDNTGLPQLISGNNWPPSGVPTAPAALNDAIVLSPQQSSGCHPAPVVAEYIDRVGANYPIDPQRVYVTGLSCGGVATWNYLRSYYRTSSPARAVRPAAIVPISGNGGGGWGPNNDLCGIGRIPIWAFHGDPDGTVATSGTVNAINGLNSECTGAFAPVDARMTLYPGLGHGAAVWTGTYDGSRGHDIYTWMFSYTAP